MMAAQASSTVAGPYFLAMDKMPRMRRTAASPSLACMAWQNAPICLPVLPARVLIFTGPVPECDGCMRREVDRDQRAQAGVEEVAACMLRLPFCRDTDRRLLP